LSDLRAFIAEQTGTRPSRISPETRLVQDLGMDGDDAVEFFEAFFVRYGVDPAGFDLYQHAGPEGCLPLWPWFWTRAPWADKPMAVPVSVADLLEAVVTRRWPTHRFANEQARGPS